MFFFVVQHFVFRIVYNFLRQRFASASQQQNQNQPQQAGSAPQSPQNQNNQIQTPPSSPNQSNSNVLIKANRELLIQGTFLGGALIAGLSSFKESLLTQQNYKQFEKQSVGQQKKNI